MSLDDTLDHDEFVWADTLWEETLSEGWNQDFAAQLFEEICGEFDILPLPPGSHALELFRVGPLVQGQDQAKAVEQYFIRRVIEYNKEHPHEPMMIHTFTCVERNIGDGNAYWSAMTPEKAGKGSAVEFIRKRLGMQRERVICMGDSGNDISMLGIEGYRSVVMANSSQELLDFYEQRKGKEMIKTKASKTLGVIEGLECFGPAILRRT